jgi:hypothetical protein
LVGLGLCRSMCGKLRFSVEIMEIKRGYAARTGGVAARCFVSSCGKTQLFRTPNG